MAQDAPRSVQAHYSDEQLCHQENKQLRNRILVLEAKNGEMRGLLDQAPSVIRGYQDHIKRLRIALREAEQKRPASDSECESKLKACHEKERALEVAYHHMQEMNAALLKAQALLQATVETLMVSKDVAEFNVDLMLFDTDRQPLRRSSTPPPQRRFQQHQRPSGQHQLPQTSLPRRGAAAAPPQ